MLCRLSPPLGFVWFPFRSGVSMTRTNAAPLARVFCRLPLPLGFWFCTFYVSFRPKYDTNPCCTRGEPVLFRVRLECVLFRFGQSLEPALHTPGEVCLAAQRCATAAQMFFVSFRPMIRIRAALIARCVVPRPLDCSLLFRFDQLYRSSRSLA